MVPQIDDQLTANQAINPINTLIDYRLQMIVYCLDFHIAAEQKFAAACAVMGTQMFSEKMNRPP